MTVIVDASVAIKWFVREPGHLQAIALLRHQDAEAPDLVVAELAQLAWLKCRRGEVTRAQSLAIAGRADQAFAALHSSRALVALAADLAQAVRWPVSACLYLACAVTTGRPLVTDDDRLCQAAQDGALGHLVLPLRLQ